MKRPIKNENGKQARVPSKAELMGWNVIGGPPLDLHLRQEKRIPTIKALGDPMAHLLSLLPDLNP